jgi:hypothetical protein
MSDPFPTRDDVVAWLNERFAARGLPHRISGIDVLPYMNPLWLSNWDVPQLASAAERDTIEEEIREARWKFPQVLVD